MTEPTSPYTVVTSTAHVSAEDMFLAYMDMRRRQLIAELRDVEKHLLNNGRISQSALRPVRER
jgi:hypothetical protein